jgi:glyoxylase I family protein
LVILKISGKRGREIESRQSGAFGTLIQLGKDNSQIDVLDAMVAQLQNSNIEVKVDPEKYPVGRFARLCDPEGNPIELWEPVSPA